MKSDIEISREAKVENIKDIAKKARIPEEYLECYGNDKAKVNLKLLNDLKDKKDGNLILVTAITPTPLGEGKSTTSIGLVDGLNLIGKNTIGALREPSLGPVFGIKGGACGGGYAQVNPMADINLHFTGDLHAITAANNLISACIDNHMYHGNELGIDPERIVWKRCVDLNDRALRTVTVGLDSNKEVTRKDGYNITVASEIMAILCLATSVEDLRHRIEELIIGYSYDGKVLTVKDLKIAGSVLVLLKDAIKPNLVQTLENNPIIIHGGPFANIAHGCNSILATKLALKLSDYVVTEAGFGADLGAEKFLDIKCRIADLKVSAVVLVATLKALKYHGGVAKDEVTKENVEALKKGLVNLEKHMDTLDKFGVPYVVTLNQYATDTENEIKAFDEWAKQHKVNYALSTVFRDGGKGGIELAKKVIEVIDKPVTPKYMYQLDDSVEDKLYKIATNVYGAGNIQFTEEAKKTLEQIKGTKYEKFFICVAKTPLSLTDDQKVVGAPKGFTVTIKEIRISAGARFLVCLTGAIMTMPGLPKVALAEKIDLDKDGNIVNLS